MYFQLVKSDLLICDAHNSQTVLQSFEDEGAVISVGFQNIGNETQFYASQMFIEPAQDAVYVQVINTSGHFIEWFIYAVVFVSDATKKVKPAIPKISATRIPHEGKP